MLLAAALAALVANGQPDRYALLIGAHGELRHQGNLSLAYQVLLEQGYRRENIFILDSNPPSPYYPLAAPTTRENVRLAFETLAKAVEPHDTFLIYATGHGRRVEAVEIAGGKVRTLAVSTAVLNEAEDMAREELLELLATIAPASGFAFFDLCYWGPFEVESWKTGTFVSVARADRTSYGNTFPRAFWTELRAQREPSIPLAFEAAVRQDTGTRKGFNSPEIRVR
jgi:hypothetical protein